MESGQDRVWWVDEAGHWRNYGDAYAAQFPDCYFPQENHRHGPAFEQLGLLKVAVYPRIIDVHWDVRRVNRTGLCAVLDHLLSLETPGNTKPIVALKFFFGAWNSEVYNTPGQAVERMVELSEYASAIPSEAITIANVDLRDIPNCHPKIRDCLAYWHRMDGRLGADDDFGLGDIIDHSLLFGPDTHDNQLVYWSAGAQSLASQVLGDEWRFTTRGAPVDMGSDKDYEDAMTTDYPEVMSSGEPRIDHVRAYFQLVGDDPIWLNYQRLLLPWKTAEDVPVVLCFAQQSQNLNVSFLEAAVDHAA